MIILNLVTLMAENVFSWMDIINLQLNKDLTKIMEIRFKIKIN